MSLRVAVDIGGAFTDLIAFNDQSQAIQHAKSLTTPADPVEGIVDCIRKLDPERIDRNDRAIGSPGAEAALAAVEWLDAQIGQATDTTTDTRSLLLNATEAPTLQRVIH